MSSHGSHGSFFRKNLAGCGRNDNRLSFLPSNRPKRRAMRFEEQLVELLPRLRRFARGLAGSAGDADDLSPAATEPDLKTRDRSDERPLRKEWLHTCSSRWAPYP